MWAEFQKAYESSNHWKPEWKSSPLANDHDFSDAFGENGKLRTGWTAQVHHSRVVDLDVEKDLRWRAVRKSYRPLVHGALNRYEIGTHSCITPYMGLHRAQFGLVRNDATFAVQQQMLQLGLAVLVVAVKESAAVGAAYWYVLKDAAYYGSACRVVDDVGHALVWESMAILKARGIRWVELGQVTGHNSPKELNVQFFKRGWGGVDKPFTVVRRGNEIG
jgi:hypothetical protein